MLNSKYLLFEYMFNFVSSFNNHIQLEDFLALNDCIKEDLVAIIFYFAIVSHIFESHLNIINMMITKKN